MCYVFVFDYGNHDSFESILQLAKLIKHNENQNEENDLNEKSLKFFLANKYPYIIENKQSNFFKNKEIYNERYKNEIIEFFKDKKNKYSMNNKETL
jgi:hypothetical protein